MTCDCAPNGFQHLEIEKGKKLWFVEPKAKRGFTISWYDTAHRGRGEGGGGKQEPNGPLVSHCLPLCWADADVNCHIILWSLRDLCARRILIDSTHGNLENGLSRACEQMSFFGPSPFSAKNSLFFVFDLSGAGKKRSWAQRPGTAWAGEQREQTAQRGRSRNDHRSTLLTCSDVD